MDVLKLIKEKKAIRKYSNELVPQKIIDKIIEAGIWSSAIHGFQPWKFVVVSNKETIKMISDILLKKSRRIGTGANVLLHSTADTISGSSVVIAVYNTKEFTTFANKFRKSYLRVTKMAETEAIGAVIQNMLLVADNLKVGGCWLITSSFCDKEINTLLNMKDVLMAIVTLGYPAEEGRRSPRKSVSDKVRYIK